MLDLISTVVTILLRIIGMWLLFSKCNVKKIWAIVPVANNYKLALCADDEDSGAVWSITNFIFTVLVVINQLFEQYDLKKTTAGLVIMILTIIFGIINTVYGIRIYSELCTVFGRRRGWVFFLIVFDSITIFIWGASRKFMPVKTVSTGEGIESGNVAKELGKGLTININKRTARRMIFAKKTMLKDIHMNIEPGKMVLLLGGSGAGKTTFINAVTGYEKADASIILNGNDVYKDFVKVIYDIGVVPQQELIRNTDTVFRTLMDAAALRMPSNVHILERKRRVDEVMDIFGLTPVKFGMVGKQSGGQKKRISIATEYISDPSLFILDEPDSGLDGILARELMHKLHEISREGKIVIVVTHTPDRVIDLFDEVIVLAKDEHRTGRLVFKGAIDEARKFFEVDSMEEIIRTINRPEEGGLGRTDELLKKFHEMQDTQEAKEVKGNE